MRDHTGPPYPSPILEDVLRMPYDTDQQKQEKAAAARVWLAQFCLRARFVLEARDLRLHIRLKPDCSEKIDRVRRYLTAAEIDAALAEP